MSTHTQDDRAEWLAERTAWARRTLEVPADAGPEDVRAAILDRLAELDFVPMPGQRLAIRVLAEPDFFPPAADSHAPFVAALEEQRQDEVAAFAQEFFGLPLPQRRERWEELLEHCRGFAVPTLRLRALEPGLRVDATISDAEPPPVKMLAAHLCAAFVLPPAERHAAHRGFLRKAESPTANAPEQTDWAAAVRTLRRNYQTVALLDRGFLDVLLARQRMRADAKLALPAFLVAEAARPQAETAVTVTPSSPPAKRQWGIARWPWYWIVIMLVIGLGRAVTTTSNRPPPPKMPEFKMPPTIPYTPPPPTLPPGGFPTEDPGPEWRIPDGSVPGPSPGTKSEAPSRGGVRVAPPLPSPMANEYQRRQMERREQVEQYLDKQRAKWAQEAEESRRRTDEFIRKHTTLEPPILPSPPRQPPTPKRRLP